MPGSGAPGGNVVEAGSRVGAGPRVDLPRSIGVVDDLDDRLAVQEAT